MFHPGSYLLVLCHWPWWAAISFWCIDCWPWFWPWLQCISFSVWPTRAYFLLVWPLPCCAGCSLKDLKGSTWWTLTRFQSYLIPYLPWEPSNRPRHEQCQSTGTFSTWPLGWPSPKRPRDPWSKAFLFNPNGNIFFEVYTGNTEIGGKAADVVTEVDEKAQVLGQTLTLMLRPK